MLDLRAIDSSVNRRKSDLINEYYEYKNTPAQEYTSNIENMMILKIKLTLIE